MRLSLKLLVPYYLKAGLYTEALPFVESILSIASIIPDSPPLLTLIGKTVRRRALIK